MKKMLKRFGVIVLSVACILVSMPQMAYISYAEEFDTETELIVETENDSVVEDEIYEEEIQEEGVPEDGISEEVAEEELLGESEEEITEEVLSEDEILDEEPLDEELLDEDLSEELLEEELSDIEEFDDEGLLPEEEESEVIQLQDIGSRCGDNLYFVYSNNYALTITGTGPMWDDFIWPFDVTLVSKVVINSGITKIGNGAFKDFRYSSGISRPSKYSITIPESVKEIGEYAFSNSNFSEIILPESVEEIGKNAFEDCSKLEKINIPDKVKVIHPYTFHNCNELSDISLPDGLTAIEEMAFAQNSAGQSNHFKSLNLPDSLEYIGERAFWCCDNLEKIIIPDSVNVINKEAFSECTNLKEIVFPNNLTFIDERAFYKCKSLKELSFPNSLKRIGSSAFEYCNALEKINLPESLNYIGGCAFRYCSDYTIEGDISGWYEIIGSIDREGDIQLIEVKEENIRYAFGTSTFACTKNLALNGKCGDNLTYSIVTDKYSENATLTISGSGPMWDDCKLTSFVNYTKIIIESGVTRIGNNAFNDMSISELDIPNTVTEIGDGAFKGCKCETISIPGNVKIIGKSAFEGCGITYIGLEEGLTKIGDYAFCDNKFAVYGDYEIPNTVTIIGEGAFKGAWVSSGVYDVTIPGSVKIISKYAFANNIGINILIGDGVEEIGEQAFALAYDNGYEQEIFIPGSVKKIGYRAFSGRSELKKVEFGEGVEEIGDEAFSNCYGLEEVIFHDGIKSIGSKAFYESYLSSIKIPDSVSFLGTFAFSGVYPDYISEDVREMKPSELICGGGWCKLDGTPYDLAKAHKEKYTREIPQMDLYRNMKPGVLSFTVSGTADEHSFIGMVANPTEKEFEKKVEEKTEFSFYVKVESKYEIDKVTYQVGSENAVILYPTNGKYTIPKGKITNDTFITVSSKAIMTDLSKCTIIPGFYDEENDKWQDNIANYSTERVNSPEGITADRIVIKSGKNDVPLTTEDYTVSYLNNKSAGTAYVKVVAKPDSEFVKGEKEQAFLIKGLSISDAKSVAIEYSAEVDWAGYETCFDDEIKVYDITRDQRKTKKGNPGDGTWVLLEKISGEDNKNTADYGLIYSNNDKPGTATVTVIGLNAYEGSKDIKIKINKPNFSKAIDEVSGLDDVIRKIVVTNPDDEAYDGTKKTPSVDVYYGTAASKNKLVEGKDYTLSYKNNVNAGIGTVTVKGKGNYQGSVSRTFTIKKILLTNANVEVSVPNMAYTGKEVKPNPVVTMRRDDGSVITLKKGTDYIVNYQNNKEKSSEDNKAKAIIIAKEKNYSGSYTKEFLILEKDRNITEAFAFDTTSEEAKAILNKPYTGEAQKLSEDDLAVIVKEAEEGVDYKVSYGPNVNAGKVKVTFTGIGEYYGTKTIEMVITKRAVNNIDELNDFEITLDGKTAEEYGENCYFTGYAYRPQVVVKDTKINGTTGHILTLGQEYTLSYKNNTNVGKADVVITFKGNYFPAKTVKTITKSFSIKGWKLTEAAVSIEEAYFLGGKKEVKPAVTLKYNDSVVNPKAYKVAYDKTTDKNVGMATVKISPAKGLKDTNIFPDTEGTSLKPLVKEYEIQKGCIENAIVSSIKPQIYKGKAIIPPITVKYNGVKLIEGTDYSVTCDISGSLGGFSKGYVNLVINALDDSNYSGSKTVKFIFK